MTIINALKVRRFALVIANGHTRRLVGYRQPAGGGEVIHHLEAHLGERAGLYSASHLGIEADAGHEQKVAIIGSPDVYAAMDSLHQYLASLIQPQWYAGLACPDIDGAQGQNAKSGLLAHERLHDLADGAVTAGGHYCRHALLNCFPCQRGGVAGAVRPADFRRQVVLAQPPGGLLELTSGTGAMPAPRGRIADDADARRHLSPGGILSPSPR